MSLLLDALRKSERQRNLSKSPDINVPLLGADDHHTGRYRLPLLLVGLLLVGAVSWWLLSTGVPLQDDDAGMQINAAPTDVNAAAASSDSAELAAVDNEAQAAPSFRVPQPRPQPLADNTVQPAQPDARRAAGQTVLEDQQRGSLSTDLPTAMDRQPQQAATMDELARLAESRLAESGQPQAASVGPTTDAAELAQSGSQSDNGSGADTDADSQASAAQSGDDWKPAPPAPISYYQLPVSVRQELVDFNVSIRVYNDDPEQRFAVINQQRFYEGDDVGEGMQLVTIRRDELVFQYQEYLFVYR
ncbi:MAG: general secretion pathway protein GspB [Gammaproteobacteria bacterium]|jgi:general secretion pathway protein B|nr:general secretion pathway protein GspB [Gammaproteobacteria bacterium]